MKFSIYLVPPLMGKTTTCHDFAAGKLRSSEFDVVIDFDVKRLIEFNPGETQFDLACWLLSCSASRYHEDRVLWLMNDYGLFDRIMCHTALFSGYDDLLMVLPSVNKGVLANRASARYKGNVPLNMTHAIDRIVSGEWETFARSRRIKTVRVEYLSDLFI